jgi:hypothetical protein
MNVFTDTPAQLNALMQSGAELVANIRGGIWQEFPYELRDTLISDKYHDLIMEHAGTYTIEQEDEEGGVLEADVYDRERAEREYDATLYRFAQGEIFEYLSASEAKDLVELALEILEGEQGGR